MAGHDHGIDQFHAIDPFLTRHYERLTIHYVPRQIADYGSVTSFPILYSYIHFFGLGASPHIVACVGNDDDLREITIGVDGALEHMPTNSVFIDHSTTSAEVAREVAAAAGEYQVNFLDAPVSGGEAGAQAGQLTVMCGGSEHAFRLAEPIISCYAKACNLMGSSGAGQLTKMVNQICIGGLLQGLSEGLNFGLAAGLDMEQVIDVISKGAAQSWQMDNRARTMCRDEFEFGFAVDLMRKDLGIVMAQARAQNAQLPVTELVDSYYAELQHRGYNRLDTSCLIKLLRDD